jgi:methionyl-tRNA synthetase
MVEWTEEENYKFRLSSFKQSLIDWLEASPDCQYHYRTRSSASKMRS